MQIAAGRTLAWDAKVDVGAMASVPCRGDGPLHLGSVYPTYRDCTKPEMKNVDRAPWILPERK